MTAAYITIALAIAGLVVYLIIRAAMAAARKRGEAEAREKGEREARELEAAMNAEIQKDKNTEDDIEKLNEGKF